MNILDEYEAFRARVANDEITDGQFCAQRGHALAALNAAKAGDPQWAERVLTRRRGSYAEQLLEVDKSLIRRAREGDAKAVQLMYARFENWTPKQADQAAAGKKGASTFADLLAEQEDSDD